MVNNFPLSKFSALETPFYYYDTDLLEQTLKSLSAEVSKYDNFHVHYAVKANANRRLLELINKYGFGADCVSGGEIRASIETGFRSDSIVFAGVGKSDWEINLALKSEIFCFNVESVQELEIINELAKAQGKTARICFRINPEVGAHTHANITTGLAENKFGIAMSDMLTVFRLAKQKSNVETIGLHFHIGSQILDMEDFKALCCRINELQEILETENISINVINVGGGLGVNYTLPKEQLIPNFKDYFSTYATHLKLKKGQQVHFELGRSIVGQCGFLISKVLYIKQGIEKQFLILDAGMTELIRPALYDAHHYIENLTSTSTKIERYDVVGPICESSDTFGKDIPLSKSKRDDLIVIHSAGAYGEIMASSYNCRSLPKVYYKDLL